VKEMTAAEEFFYTVQDFEKRWGSVVISYAGHARTRRVSKRAGDRVGRATGPARRYLRSCGVCRVAAQSATDEATLIL
jgi:hypothetical protein